MISIDRVWRLLERVTTVASLLIVALIVWRISTGQSLTARPAQAGNVKAVVPVSDVKTSVNETSRIPQGAKVVVVEFSDYECPYCGRYSRDVYPSVHREYVATGQVGYVMRALPLENSHPLALGAAEAAECAGKQGRFWEMHDRLFEQQRLDGEALNAHARAVGLDMALFAKCVKGATLDKIRADQAEARRLGVRATPTFFVGVIEGDGQVNLKERINGIVSYEVFSAAIDRVRAGA